MGHYEETKQTTAIFQQVHLTHTEARRVFTGHTVDKLRTATEHTAALFLILCSQTKLEFAHILIHLLIAVMKFLFNGDLVT